MKNYFSSHTAWSLVVAAIVGFGNQLLPILPPVWANLVTALLGLYAFYSHGQVVSAARSAGVRGV